MPKYRKVPQSSYGYPDPISDMTAAPIVSSRDPVLSDNYPLGTLWINKVSQTAYTMTGFTGGEAQWKASTGASSGGGITNFIVDPSDPLLYNSIQAAIDAAFATGSPNLVYVKTGTYTEDLVIKKDISLLGADISNTKIIGSHSFSGADTKVTISDFTLNGGPKLFQGGSSSGSPTINFFNLDYALTVAGKFCEYITCTPSIKIDNVINTGGFSDDGFDALDADIVIDASKIGRGNIAPFQVINGSIEILNSEITPLTECGGTCSYDINADSYLKNGFTTYGTATGYLRSCLIKKDTFSCVKQESTGNMYIDGTIIDTLVAPAIDGLVGTGSIRVGNITYINDNSIGAATVLDKTPTFTCSNLDVLNGYSLTGITDGAFLIGDGAGNPMTELGPLTNGQILVGSTGSDPIATTITSASGSISHTEGAGTISIDINTATESQIGGGEIATNAEAIDKSDDTKLLTPLKIKQVMSNPGKIGDVTPSSIVGTTIISDSFSTNHTNTIIGITENQIYTAGDDTNVDLLMTAKGTGQISLSGIKFPNTIAASGQVLQSDGTDVVFGTVSIPTATETVSGGLEVATIAETVALTVDDKIITPLKIGLIFAKPPALGSSTPAAITGTNIIGDDVTTSNATSNVKLINNTIVSGGTDTDVDVSINTKNDGEIKCNANVVIDNTGDGLKIKEGTNARMGVATLSTGTIIVNTTAVSATSRIFLSTEWTGSGQPGAVFVASRVSGTSFTINGNPTDDNDVVWMIVDPA